VPERYADEISDAVRLTRCDDVVARFLLPKHQPDRPNIVDFRTPIATRVEATEQEFVVEADTNRGRTAHNLTRDELNRSPRRLMVKENSRAGKQAISVAVPACDEVALRLRNAVGRQRSQRRFFPCGISTGRPKISLDDAW
jgi:hypothetical protein